MDADRRRSALICSILATLALVRAASARAPGRAPAESLDRCAATVQKAGAKFERGTVTGIAACLEAMSTAVIQDGATPPAAAASATASCVRRLRKLADSRGHGLANKMAAAIAERCDPGRRGVSHTVDDVTGKGTGLVREPIKTANIDAWCRAFGGDGSIDSVAEWVDCLRRAHECAARATIAAEYPRAVEWLRVLAGEMEARRSAAPDPVAVSDAASAAGAAATAIAGASDGDAPGIRCGVVDQGSTDPVCGDGVRNGSESCDGADLGGETCTGLGFLGGTLACGTACRLDTSGCLTDLCGDGVRNGIESCDGADLGGQTCTGLGFGGGTLACTPSCGLDTSACTTPYPATGQTSCWDAGGSAVACPGTGHDGDVRAGVPLAYTDNGDGTITDHATGLMWEKKSADGTIHDKDTVYSWANAFAVQVAGLNAGAGFAGHTDWRLPNVKELESLVDFEESNPAVASAFDTGCTPGCTVTTCSCTTPSTYWSSTTNVGFAVYAWYVNFGSGAVSNDQKVGGRLVRAVRGGS